MDAFRETMNQNERWIGAQRFYHMIRDMDIPVEAKLAIGMKALEVSPSDFADKPKESFQAVQTSTGACQIVRHS